MEYLFWFFLVTRLIENDRDFAVFYGALVVMALCIAAHGIYQYIVAAPIPSSWVSQTEASVRTRVYSLTGSPNIMGSLLVLFAPMVAGLAYYSSKMWVKVLAVCATGMMCLSCIFTFSKGAWGGLAVAVVIFAIFLDRRLIALMGVAGVGALLAIRLLRTASLICLPQITLQQAAAQVVSFAGPRVSSCCRRAIRCSASASAASAARLPCRTRSSRRPRISPTSTWITII